MACLIAVVLFPVSLAMADGMFVPSEENHLRSPQQKAAIAWDGVTEQMVLVSKVQSDKISDLAWVVPVESHHQPRVEKSNIAVFKDLTAFFGVTEPASPFDSGILKTAGNGVEVVEEKKIDIYDIAILKADSGGEIQQWLNTNGYKTPPEAKSILDGYARRPNMYFVANRIDLKNKYAVEDQKAADLYQEVKRFLEDKKVIVEKSREAGIDAVREEQQAFCSTWKTVVKGGDWDADYFQCMIGRAREQLVKEGVSARDFTPPYKAIMSVADIDLDNGIWVSFWLADDYDGKRASAMISYRQSQLFSVDLTKTIAPNPFNRQQFAYVSPDVLDRAERNGRIIAEVFREGRDVKVRLIEKKKAFESPAGMIEDVQARLAQKTPASLFCRPQEFLSGFPEDVPGTVLAGVVWPEAVVTGSEYCQTVDALMSGLATPLKISFEPQAPYYPMAISSTGDGNALVDVYVIAKNPVLDQNGVMGENKALRLDPGMKDKMTVAFGTGPWQQVTRFSWSGELRSLKADAVFKER